ncbi:xanthine dehydrogenase/oxidase [Mycena olivaceomarginata]|nr:xanthine dehydrogenase/oxidase [Mycena olivaceomarginata]
MSTTTFQDFESRASSTLRFFLNGSPIVLDGNSFDPDSTLLDFIRSQGQGFTGTKLGCGEGGCGACTVVIQSRDPANQIQHLAINACLAPIVSVDGKHIITVEGVGSPEHPHPIQERLWKLSGSQCGIIMSLYALVRNAAYRGSLSTADVELDGVLDGNLCRCTGYKPILDAAKTFVGEYTGKLTSSDPVVPINFEAANLDHGDCCSNPASRGAAADCCQLSGESEAAPAKFRALSPLKFGSASRQWLRPTTLSELLAIKAQYPDAKLVGGSTEIQIERILSVFVSDIAELYGLWPPTPTRRTFEFGANLSLADLEVACKRFVDESDPQLSGPIEAVRTQLRYFAGLQIRNVASVGGNIATASPISDLNPVWVATSAKLLAAAPGKPQFELPLTDFFTGYRKTTLPRDAVIVKIIVPLNDTHDQEVVRAYKQAKRRDDDIAIVTACFSMRITSERKISHVRLAYGGMAATVLSATKTERLLTGKPFSSTTLEEALELLGAEMHLPFNVPGGMASYRKTLALSFFFKFWNTVGSEINLPPDLLPSKTELEDITTIIHRQLSSGRRDNSDPYAQEVVGVQEPHMSGLLQATGAAVYVDDMPKVGNEVYGALVLSTRAHAKIVSVDVATAVEMEGVVSWVSHVDLPNERANWWGGTALMRFEYAIVYHGQPIGMIVAQTKILAQKAARGRVEYEDLPRILTLEEAIEQKSPIDEALATSDHVLEGKTRMGGQTMAVLMDVYSSTQSLADAQRWVSVACGIPRNRIVAHAKRLGGGFGGKETRSSHVGPIRLDSASAGVQTRRPVRIMLDRQEDIMITGQRHPCLADWKVGFSSEGKLQALNVDYFIPDVDVHGLCCKNQHTFRGFGGPQGMLVAEHYIEAIAEKLNLNIDHVRQINLYKEAETTTPYHQKCVLDWHVPRLLSDCRRESRYDERRAALAFGVKGAALVHVYMDGSVLVAHGGVEMGQGLYTKYSQELRVPLKDVFTSETASNTVPNTVPTAASAGSDLNGYAVFNACAEINNGPTPPLAALAAAAWGDRVSLSADRLSRDAGPGATKWNNPNETGNLISLLHPRKYPLFFRVDINMDVGRSLNPAIDYGQIEGAFTQGQGLCTIEASLWLRQNGAIFTTGPGAYKLPGFSDIPQVFNVSLLRDAEWPNLGSIKASKGVGEPPLFLGCSVALAIRYALKSARADAGLTELQDFRLPLTSERIRMACGDFLAQKGRVEPKNGETDFFVPI